MRGVLPILVSAAAVAALPGCGQKGPLFLPTGPEAAGRATLGETLTPNLSAIPPAAAASAPPTSGTAAPVRNP